MKKYQTYLSGHQLNNNDIIYIHTELKINNIKINNIYYITKHNDILCYAYIKILLEILHCKFRDPPFFNISLCYSTTYIFELMDSSQLKSQLPQIFLFHIYHKSYKYVDRKT